MLLFEEIRFLFCCPSLLLEDFAFYRLKYPYTCFYSHFCFPLIVVCGPCVFVPFLVALISLSLLFLYSLRVVVSMHRNYLRCWRILFFFLFLTHIFSRCEKSDVRPYVSSLVFLFSGTFVKVLPSSTSKMVQISYKPDSPGVYLLNKISAI